MGCHGVLQRRDMATSRSISRKGSKSQRLFIDGPPSHSDVPEDMRGRNAGDEGGGGGKEPDRRGTWIAPKPGRREAWIAPGPLGPNAEAFAAGLPGGDSSPQGMGTALDRIDGGEGEDDGGNNDVELISAEICSLKTLIEAEALLLRCGGATQVCGTLIEAERPSYSGLCESF